MDNRLQEFQKRIYKKEVQFAVGYGQDQSY
jgi:hypothetical protein